MAKINGIVVVFIVGSSLEKNGEFSWCHWPVNVSMKHGAVAHFHADVVFNGHGVWLSCKSKLRNES
jgi:hypothetical protein